VKLRSFRIRIALWSAILAGSALAGFGLISWWLIYEAKVSRLDAELESQLMRTGRPRPRDRWQSYETSLWQSFGTNAKTPIALLVIGADGNVLYRSDEWAADLDTKNLWTSRPQAPPFPPPQSNRQIVPFPERTQSPPEPPPDRSPPTPRFVTQRTASGTWRVGAVTTPFAQVAIAVSLNGSCPVRGNFRSSKSSLH
jgi:hypothetical protein